MRFAYYTLRKAVATAAARSKATATVAARTVKGKGNRNCRCAERQGQGQPQLSLREHSGQSVPAQRGACATARVLGFAALSANLRHLPTPAPSASTPDRCRSP